MELEFFASCLSGAEPLLADELKVLGARRVRPLGGGVAFFGEPETAYRACLWSRLAARVVMVVGRVDAGDADALYAGARGLPWEDVLAEGATFAVRAHGTNGNLRNTRFTALKVKDALADRMREARGARPTVDARSPRAAVDVRVREGRATVSLDFSGEALNRRAYLAPDEAEDAALECSLAAAALALGGWDDMARAGAGLVDPACRDGIVLVEAALAACDCAPGLQRGRWGFQGWAGYDASAWEALLAEARERFAAGLRRWGADAGDASGGPAAGAAPAGKGARFIGLSSSSPQVRRARNHVQHAGVRGLVSVEYGDAADAGAAVARASARRPVMVAADINAASRAGAPAQVLADEAAFARAAAVAPGGSRFVALGAQDASARLGAAPVADQAVGRGRIQTRIQVFDAAPGGTTRVEVPDLAGGAPHGVDALEPASAQFAARLRKVFKERRKWAARAGVSCYRVYDADLPDYAVAIDWYTGAGASRGNDYLHVAEYAPPASVDADKARRRFADVLAIAPVVCGVRADHVFAKTRVREKGGGQYRKAGRKPYVAVVEEAGHRFEVDLAGRLDTGLFLDHRATRALVGDMAAGARFLNLFAYTGTASVYAAAGGAVETTTVDLSQTHLEWARRNMAENGFAGPAHMFERADVGKWVTEARRAGKRYDLAFVDPPTFSNSKAMGKRTWDVQRDHAELLIGVSRLLADDGRAVFSCNLRSFRPDVETLAKYGVELEDISLSTIPEDFARTPKIHKCYLVRRAR